MTAFDILTYYYLVNSNAYCDTGKVLTAASVLSTWQAISASSRTGKGLFRHLLKLCQDFNAIRLASGICFVLIGARFYPLFIYLNGAKIAADDRQ